MLFGLRGLYHVLIFKRPTRDACLYMGRNQALPAPLAQPAPRFVFQCDHWADSFQIWQVYAGALGIFFNILQLHFDQSEVT